MRTISKQNGSTSHIPSSVAACSSVSRLGESDAIHTVDQAVLVMVAIAEIQSPAVVNLRRTGSGEGVRRCLRLNILGPVAIAASIRR